MLAQLRSKVAAAAAWQPLTLRGVMSLALSIPLIQWYAIPQSDLLAALLGAAFAVLPLATAFIALLLRVRFNRQIEAEQRFDLHKPISRYPVPAGITLKNSSVIPYFSLGVRRCFDHEGVQSPSHILKGKEPELGKRHLIDSVWFPHRGLWTCGDLELDLRDNLGLTRYRWKHPCPAGIEIAAPTIEVRPLPILAASSQSGDHLHHTENRSGDLFDIKAYDPSDGVKKILWKTYAKSRELVVRRPEPAVVPEGEVAIYLIAARKEDHVAGALQGYLRQLFENNISVLFGTDGVPNTSLLESNGNSLAGPAQYYCVSHDDIYHAINCSSWSPDAGSGRGFREYLSSLAGDNRRVHRVVVFADADSHSQSLAKTDSWLNRLHADAAAFSVQLTIALVPQSISGIHEPPADFISSPPITEKLKEMTGSLSQTLRLLRNGAMSGSTEQTQQPLPLGQSEFLLVEGLEQGR